MNQRDISNLLLLEQLEGEFSPVIPMGARIKHIEKQIDALGKFEVTPSIREYRMITCLILRQLALCHEQGSYDDSFDRLLGFLEHLVEQVELRYSSTEEGKSLKKDIISCAVWFRGLKESQTSQNPES